MVTHEAVNACVGSVLLDVLDAEKGVVLAHTLRTSRGTRLDDTRVEGDGKVSNRRVLRLTGAVRHHDSPVVGLSELSSLDRLGDRADLVDLEQKTVACLLLDGRLDTEGVRDRQVITDDRNAGLTQYRPGFPVVLVEWVLNRRDRVLLEVALVDVGELSTRDPLAWVRVGVLEVQVVLALLVEFRAGDVKRDVHAALVASHLDSIDQQVKRLVSRLEVRSKATLVTDVGSVNAVLALNDLLERVVHLRADLNRLSERLGTRGHNHELLEGQGVTGVRATVDHVHSRGGQDVGGTRVGQLRKVLVEWHVLLASASLGSSDRNTQDGIGTELTLIGGAVQLDQEVVNLFLGRDRNARLDQLRGDHVVHVGNSLVDTLADPLARVLVTQLDGLVHTRGRTRWHGSTEKTLLRVQVDLDGRVAARVDDHASLNLLDAHLVCIGVGGKELRGIGPEFIKTLAQVE